jgi:protoporphyrinogen oxidase
VALFRRSFPAERVSCSVPTFSSSGAGPAGLPTAHTLAKAGRAVTVIEKDAAYVGGISRTVNYKGFLFDIGGHRFF